MPGLSASLCLSGAKSRLMFQVYRVGVPVGKKETMVTENATCLLIQTPAFAQNLQKERRFPNMWVSQECTYRDGAPSSFNIEKNS